MKKIEDFINQSEYRNRYKEDYENLSKKQKEELYKLVVKLDNEGAKNPLGWALSEIKEGIPQFSRFLFLKEIFNIINDIEENVSLADDIDENYDEDIFEVSEKLEKFIGKKEFNKFLKSYTKGVMWQILNMIDEGNYNNEDKPMWSLMEDDTEKNINSLHENFNEFEEEINTNT